MAESKPETTPSTSSELDDLNAVFEARIQNILDSYESGKFEEAKQMAAPLLIEPRLSKIHQASLHLLLSSCSDEVVRHAEEAVRLYGEFLQDHEFTPEQRADVVKLQDAAEDTLKRARDDQAAMERDFDQAFPSGEIMSDEQFKALQERELLAPEDDEKAGVKDNGSE